MKNLLKLLFLFTILFCASCNDDDAKNDIPDKKNDTELTVANKTFAEVMALAPESGKPAIQLSDSIVIRGVVIYETASKNQNYTLFIQSIKQAIAIKISTDHNGEYYKGLELKQEVSVSLKGLWIGNKFGQIMIGSGADEKYTVSSLTDKKLKSILLSGKKLKSFTPTVKTIDKLSVANLGALIKIENVQFTDNSKAKTFYDSKDKSYTIRRLTTKEGLTIDVSTYKNAIFKDEKTLSTKCSVVGILSQFDSKWQLILRNTKDVVSTGERFTIVVKEPTVFKTIFEVKALLGTSASKVITENWGFYGVVTSNQGVSGNFYKSLYVQDKTGAICIRIAEGENMKALTIGQKVLVSLKAKTVILNNGILMLGNSADIISNYGKGLISDGDLARVIFNKDGGVKVVAKVVTLSDITDAMLGQLITINNIQFLSSDTAKTITEKARIGDVAKSTPLQVYVSSYAKVISKIKLPLGSGSITGILLKSGDKYSLTIRDAAEINISDDINTRFNDGTVYVAFNNWGFEQWDDANTPTGYTKAESIEKETSIVHSGKYSAKQTGGTKDLTIVVPVVAGKTYEVSLWYYIESGDGTDLRIWSNWKSSTGNLADDAAVLKGPDNGYFADEKGVWKEYKVTVTAPEGATQLNFEVRTYGSAVGYWDDFLVREVK